MLHLSLCIPTKNKTLCTFMSMLNLAIINVLMFKPFFENYNNKADSISPVIPGIHCNYYSTFNVILLLLLCCISSILQNTVLISLI